MRSKNPEPSSLDLDVEEIKNFYDSVYYANAHDKKEDRIRGHYARLFKRLKIGRDARILDVACGAGGWLKVCQEHGARVSGVDLSENAIAVCQERMPSGDFHAQPAETLPFDDAQFDVVTCLGSLEHFVDPKNSLQEMVRVAKQGAIFIILVPNKDFLTRKLGLFRGTYQVDAKEVVRTLDDWRQLFARAGLTIEERWKDLHVINRGWVMTGKIYLWPFRALQCLCLLLWPLKWQYQVYHRCLASSQATTANSARAHAR